MKNITNMALILDIEGLLKLNRGILNRLHVLKYSEECAFDLEC